MADELGTEADREAVATAWADTYQEDVQYAVYRGCLKGLD